MRVETGIMTTPPILVVYGESGIGKTTFACSGPNPIVIQCEPGGAARVDTARYVWERADGSTSTVAESWSDIDEAVAALLTEEHDYKTVVLDSADWAEKLCQSEVARAARKPSVQEIPYGAGLVAAAGKWQHLLAGLQRLRDGRGMTVVVIAHAKVEPFADPTSEQYDRYVLAMDKRVTSVTVQWAEAVLFAGIRVQSVPSEQTKGGKGSVKVVGRERVLRCTPCASCLAKNRFGMPDELPLRMDDFGSIWEQLGGTKESE